MANKLPLKDILAAIDMGAFAVWDELEDDEKKQISFWLLNRYASAVRGNRELQELAVFKTNEYYNKNWINLSTTKHAKLFWQTLCLAGNAGKIQNHEYIGHKKRGGENNSKAVKLLQELYPNLKDDEVELLARISTKKELKQLAEEHGIENVKL
jgi:hypothetical protein